MKGTRVPSQASPSPPLPTDAETNKTTKTLPRSTDNDSSSSGDASVNGETPPTPNPPPPPPIRNVSRERKRAELMALRDEVDALERERNVIVRKRKQHADVMPTRDADTWRRAAETARVTRARAETENERLVTMLQQQIGLADALERVLRKRARQEPPADQPNAPPLPQRNHCDTSTSMLHAQFSRDIQRMYRAGIPRLFNGNGWSAAGAELGLSVVREEKVDETTQERMVEMRETRHVPFEYQRVANAMWRCAVQPFAEKGRVLESYSSRDDEIVIKYRAATTGLEAQGDLLTAMMVMQNIHAPDRAVYMWRTMSTEENGSQTAQRAFSDESGCIIIEPVPPGISGLEPGSAVVQFVAQLVPLRPHGYDATDAESGHAKPDHYYALVVEASCEDMVALGDAVGNLLLDESLGLATDLHSF